MNDEMTQDQVVATVTGLTALRLSAFVDAHLVVPILHVDTFVFRPVDVARLALLCDLADDFDLDVDALGVVMGLIDQLHATRRHLHAMARAIESEPVDLRQRIGARFISVLAG
jgi:chaperone modulatory protein CbpM